VNLISFPNSEVHIWHAYINKQVKNIEFFKSLLSIEESEKINNLYLEKNKKKSIISRALLRYILSLYIDINPNEIKFIYNKHGKPYLDIKQNSNNINFNLSHSNNLIVYAIAKNQELGIDVEKFRNNFDINKLAKRYFSENELSIFEKVSENKKIKIFFSIWTKKEAFLKAKGMGIYTPLNKINVSSNFIEDNNELWQFENLKINYKYSTKLAVKNKDYSVKYFLFNKTLWIYTIHWIFSNDDMVMNTKSNFIW